MDFVFPVSPNLAFCFGTPILVAQVSGFAEVNRALAALIRARMAEDGGVYVSNRGGWQSTHDLWDWDSSAIETYKGWVHSAILRMAAITRRETDLSKVEIDYRAGAWVNVNRHGHYNDSHIHPDADWAVVYYVETGTPEPGWDRNGKIELFDPRTLSKTSSLGAYGFGRSLLIDPEPGKIIVFPGWMEHSVHPFYGAGDRISIACNVMVTGGRHSGRE